MMTSLNVFSLPEEIILKILEDGDYRAILACKHTCRSAYNIISKSISLRYSLELTANGMLHGLCSSSLGQTQCLKRLVAHETAWRTLSWTGSASVDALIGWGQPVSVSGNVLCFLANSGISHQELLLLRAPSKLRNVVGKTWKIQFPCDIQDVCIDSALDLLICRCGFKSFRVCSLSSGRIHPLAQHVGVINATSTWRYCIGSMRVCGDSFAVACEKGLHISVWNWKSGEHTLDFMALLQTPVFTFLDEYHILLPGWTGDSIYVYDIRAVSPINKKQTLNGTHCFEIPTSQLWGHDLEPVCSITLDYNSLSSGVDSETAVPGIFYTDPDDRVVSLRIIAELDPTSIHDADWWHDYREIHVHAQSLLMWTQAHPALSSSCVVIPWSAWGPAGARVVPPHMDGDNDVVNKCRSQSRFSGCGMRIVSTPSVRSDGTPSVTVTDYHPARVIRGRKRSQIVHDTANATPTEIEENSGHMREVANAGHCNPSAQPGMYSKLKSNRLPLSTFSSSPSPHSMSAMGMIKNLLLFRWYSPPQELEEATIEHVPQTAARKMEFLEKEISLPKEFRFDTSRPVFNVLIEDGIMFYTIVPETNIIQHAHWYTF